MSFFRSISNIEHVETESQLAIIIATVDPLYCDLLITVEPPDSTIGTGESDLIILVS